MVASKTWKRSPARSQMVISPEVAAVMAAGEVPGVVVSPHAARMEAPPVASSAPTAVLFKKERRETWLLDGSDADVVVVGCSADVDIRVLSFPHWKMNKNLSDGA